MTTKNETKNEESQAEIVNAIPEQPQVIPLDIDDIRTGLAFAHETAKAQARLQAAFDSESTFLGRMREKYRIDTSQYALTDWITGFVKVKSE